MVYGNYCSSITHIYIMNTQIYPDFSIYEDYLYIWKFDGIERVSADC